MISASSDEGTAGQAGLWLTMMRSPAAPHGSTRCAGSRASTRLTHCSPSRWVPTASSGRENSYTRSGDTTGNALDGRIGLPPQAHGSSGANTSSGTTTSHVSLLMPSRYGGSAASRLQPTMASTAAARHVVPAGGRKLLARRPTTVPARSVSSRRASSAPRISSGSPGDSRADGAVDRMVHAPAPGEAEVDVPKTCPHMAIVKRRRRGR